MPDVPGDAKPTLACKLCIAEKGFTLKTGQLFHKDDELIEHLESVHHRPVLRDGETPSDAIARFLAKYPEAATCDDCRRKGMPWVQTL
jgi:enoyl reductase-like protein